MLSPGTAASMCYRFRRADKSAPRLTPESENTLFKRGFIWHKLPRSGFVLLPSYTGRGERADASSAAPADQMWTRPSCVTQPARTAAEKTVHCPLSLYVSAFLPVLLYHPAPPLHSWHLVIDGHISPRTSCSSFFFRSAVLFN